MNRFFLVLFFVVFNINVSAQPVSGDFSSGGLIQLQEMLKGLEDQQYSSLNLKPENRLSREKWEEIYDQLSAHVAETITVAIYNLPKIYWQYIVPSLYVTPLMPDELLNNPDFLPYKGQKPTLIDPDWKDYADKYLDDLHPALYAYVMPKQMPGEGDAPKTIREALAVYAGDDVETFPKTFFMEDQPSSRLVDLAFAMEPSEKYASGEYLNEKPDEVRDGNITETSLLRGGDVLAFVNSLSEASLIGEKNNQIQIVKNNSIDEVLNIISGGSTQNEILNPCSFFVNGLDGELSVVFNQIVKKHGFSKDTWAYTCDKTIKAYRLYSLDIQKLDTILGLVAQKEVFLKSEDISPQGKEYFLKSVDNMKKRYSGNPKDMNAVKWYMDKIKKTFYENKMRLYLKTEL